MSAPASCADCGGAVTHVVSEDRLHDLFDECAGAVMLPGRTVVQRVRVALWRASLCLPCRIRQVPMPVRWMPGDRCDSPRESSNG